MFIRRPTQRLATIVAVAILLQIVPSALAVADNGVTQVSGIVAPDTDGSCTTDPTALFAGGVTGTLVGCYYADTANYEHTNQGGGFVATGTETWDVCLGTVCGKFFTTYTFTAKYQGDVEQHGRCHHPIVDGDGGFAGASGVINMHDQPNGCAAYKGHIDL